MGHLTSINLSDIFKYLIIPCTCLNFTLFASQNVQEMWHSPFNSNSYVDDGNIIHFAVKVWTLEGRLDTGRNIRQIGPNGLTVPACNSVVQTFIAKRNIFPYSAYKLGLNGLCHIPGAFGEQKVQNLKINFEIKP